MSFSVAVVFTVSALGSGSRRAPAFLIPCSSAVHDLRSATLPLVAGHLEHSLFLSAPQVEGSKDLSRTS